MKIFNINRETEAGLRRYNDLFKTASGEELPVYKSVNGKFFVCRQSKKTGNYYKQYITIEN